MLKRSTGIIALRSAQHYLQWITAAAALLIGSVTISAEETAKEFDLPAQPLAESLQQVAERFDLKIAFYSEFTEGLKAPALSGTLTPSQAFNVLLADTPLVYVYVVETTVAIRPLTSSPTEGGSTMNNKKNMKKKAGLLAMLASVFTGGSALAAERETKATADSNKVVIEEIVVTATKRDTSLQDTPIAVTAFTTEDLYRQGIENFEDFGRRSPGVTVSGSGNYQKFTIRGIQSTSAIGSPGNMYPVNVYYDDVPVVSMNITTPNHRLYDIERVEVLRGPQGTSFGAGSLSGAVRIITNKANLDGFDTSVRVEAASTAQGGTRHRYNGMVNVPLSDSAALRLVGYVVNEEGWLDNAGFFGSPFQKDYNRSEEWGARASLRWEPNDRSALTFSIAHDDIDHPNGLTAGEYFPVPPLRDGVVGAPDVVGDYVAGQQPMEVGNWVEMDRFNLIFEYDFTWAQLVSSTSWSNHETYYDLDLDGVDVGWPFWTDENISHDAIVQELRLVSSQGGNVEWLAGLFYLNRETDLLGDIHTTGEFLDSQGIDYSALSNAMPILPSHVGMDPNVRDIESKEAAIFAELTYRFTETLSLTAGVRYTEFEYKDGLTAKGWSTNLFDLIGGGVGGVATSTPDPALPTTTGKQNATTTKFILNWQPNDDQTLYFSAAQGFRRPHPNANALLPGINDDPDTSPIPLAADGDELWNYELGAKTRWLDGRLQANVAAYFIDWTDAQIPLVRPATARTGGNAYTGNSGDVESKGIEAELLYWPTANLQLGLNLTLASAEIVSLTQEQAFQAGFVKGSPLPAPEEQFSGFAQYTYPLQSGGAIYGRVDVQYAGDYPNGPPNQNGSLTQAPNANFQYTDAYENVNLQVGWEMDKVTLVLFGENVLDNRDFIYVNPDTYTFNRFYTLRPRTIGLRAEWHF